MMIKRRYYYQHHPDDDAEVAHTASWLRNLDVFQDAQDPIEIRPIQEVPAPVRLPGDVGDRFWEPKSIVRWITKGGGKNPLTRETVRLQDLEPILTPDTPFDAYAATVRHLGRYHWNRTDILRADVARQPPHRAGAPRDGPGRRVHPDDIDELLGVLQAAHREPPSDDDDDDDDDDDLTVDGANDDDDHHHHEQDIMEQEDREEEEQMEQEQYRTWLTGWAARTRESFLQKLEANTPAAFREARQYLDKRLFMTAMVKWWNEENEEEGSGPSLEACVRKFLIFRLVLWSHMSERRPLWFDLEELTGDFMQFYTTVCELRGLDPEDADYVRFELIRIAHHSDDNYAYGVSRRDAQKFFVLFPPSIGELIFESLIPRLKTRTRSKLSDFSLTETAVAQALQRASKRIRGPSIEINHLEILDYIEEEFDHPHESQRVSVRTHARFRPEHVLPADGSDLETPSDPYWEYGATLLRIDFALADRLQDFL